MLGCLGIKWEDYGNIAVKKALKPLQYFRCMGKLLQLNRYFIACGAHIMQGGARFIGNLRQKPRI